ncbi:MAG: hypothetical protein J1F20_00915 [Muribaculaceae bacterium]|nr:hypothetical protein [Muribaculaceae bacterium]
MPKRFLGINPTFLLILLLLQGLQAFNNPILYYIGFASSLIVIICGCISGLLGFCKKPQTIFIWVSLFSLWTLFNSIILGSSNFIYSFLLQTSLLFFALGLYYSKIAIKTMIIFEKIFTIFFIIYLGIAIYIYTVYGEYVLTYLSMGATGLKLTFVFSLFFLIKSKNKLIPSIIISLLFLYIGERTAAIIIPLIYLLYKLFNIKLISDRYSNVLFCIFISVAIILPFIYLNLKEIQLGSTLNDISQEYTNANFYSGRDRIWSTIIENNKGREWVGHGLENNVLKQNGITLSPHNLYMYIYLTGGFTSLIIFALFLYCFYKKYSQYLFEKDVRYCASVFLGILIFLDFEYLLIGNNVPVSVFLWLVMTWGLIKKKHMKKLTQSCS